MPGNQAEQGPEAGLSQYQGSSRSIVRGKPRSLSRIHRARSGTSRVSDGGLVSKSRNTGYRKAEEHAAISIHRDFLSIDS